MNSLTFVCSHCGTVHPVRKQYCVGSEMICESCARNFTRICSCCGTRIWTEAAVRDSYTILCEHCYEINYTRCCSCNDIIANNAAYRDEEGNTYCEECWEEFLTAKPIHDYSYKPTPLFYGEGERYFGVELEIDHGGSDSYAARHILGVANENAEHLYIKTDGSLDCGMELVTHPMSLDYHMNSMPWDAVLDEARSLGYLSHKTQTCGLHIHISRKAFGEAQWEQECTIARLLYFMEKFWSELLRFSRRTESQINHWAARYGMKLSPQEMIDCAKRTYAGRYMAVNLTNWNTVEIRIFRGTLKLNTLLATLQMVNAVCEAAVSMNDEALQALSWHGFLERLHEPELIQYLKERDLYKNEPVDSVEDD